MKKYVLTYGSAVAQFIPRYKSHSAAISQRLRSIKLILRMKTNGIVFQKLCIILWIQLRQKTYGKVNKMAVNIHT